MSESETEMASSYRSPDPKKTLSVRLPLSIHAKLDAIIRFWRAKAEADGLDAEEVDLSAVVIALLADKTDEELAQWGGLPRSEEAWSKAVEAIRAVAKKP